MKKRILGLGVIVAASLIAPKIIGSFVESEYKEIVEKLAKNPSINAIEGKFERSWFSAVSTIKFSVLNALESNGKSEIILQDNINFGPVIISGSGISFNLAMSSSELSFGTPLLKSTELAELLQSFKDKLAITSKLTYALSYKTHIHIDEIQKEEDGEQLLIGAVNGDFILNKDKTASVNLKWNGIKFTGDDLLIDFESLIVKSEQALVSGDFYEGTALSIGSGSILLPKLTVKTPDETELFAFEALEVDVVSSLKDDLIDFSMGYHIDKLSGQGESAENVNLDFEFRNLDVQAITELNKYLVDISSQINNSQVNESFSEEQIAELTKIGNQLLTKDPQINITDLSLTVPEGTIQSDIQTSIDSTLFTPKNPLSIILALKADAKGKAPSQFFERLGLKPFVDLYVNQGLVLENNSELSFNASFDAGKLLVNGNVIPLF